MTFTGTVKDTDEIGYTAVSLVVVVSVVSYLALHHVLVPFMWCVALIIPFLLFYLIHLIRHIDTYKIVTDDEIFQVQRNGKVWLSLIENDIQKIVTIKHQCSKEGLEDEGRIHWTLHRYAVIMKNDSIHPLPFALSKMIPRLLIAIPKWQNK